MAKLWRAGMIVFLICGLFMRRENEMIEAMLQTPQNVFELVLTLILAACLWGGFLNIIEKTGFMQYFSLIFKPVLRLIFGKVIDRNDVYTALSSNLIANLIGLGTLATMSGLRAFSLLHEISPDHSKPSREMLTLVIMNTAGVCLFPSTLIMVRQNLGSENIYEFYPYMILISFTILVVGLIIQRVIHRE